MKLQFECKEYKIYCPNTLIPLVTEMKNIFLIKIEEYKKLFNVDQLDQITINYFDDINNFRDFIYSIRGKKESLPMYAKGTFDMGMINGYVDKNNQTLRLYNANHELFHILYLKYILKNDFSKRIIWYDEGMAQFLSGEKDYLLNFDKFKNYYIKVKEETIIIPKLNEIKHGINFCNNNYNGYDLSYLCIRYLNEILNDNEFKNLMINFDKIKDYGNNIITNMFLYYDDILFNKKKTI